ncbi:unnamed protein product [Sphenostylis stenocarpa]|uniref:Uncharacterized protein n=1 Tax=Sphenostylis stenocarpa TaxID=92480 RepID=A0AA86V8Z2_9FABA|nr:unnamed protein product [Sphenostylis stenocarpa]
MREEKGLVKKESALEVVSPVHPRHFVTNPSPNISTSTNHGLNLRIKPRAAHISIVISSYINYTDYIPLTPDPFTHRQ